MPADTLHVSSPSMVKSRPPVGRPGQMNGRLGHRRRGEPNRIKTSTPAEVKPFLGAVSGRQTGLACSLIKDDVGAATDEARKSLRFKDGRGFRHGQAAGTMSTDRTQS